MIALVGNPNCGKSSLFNILTHSKEKVGNFPGVTVESKIGKFKDKKIIDLPGLYSLFPYTKEEEITVNFIKNNHIDLIINVIDINCLNRSLYLTSRLKKLNIDMILVLNKDDKKNPIKVNDVILEQLLKIPVIKISTIENKNIDKLSKLILNKKESNLKKDNKVLNLKPEDNDIINTYKLIDNITEKVIIKNKINKFNTLIDNILLNKYLSTPISIIILILIYYIAIHLVGNNIIDFINNINNTIIFKISNLLSNLHISIILKSLIIDGIINGMSSVLLFLPQVIVIMFIFSLLEDIGYIARMSLIFDKYLRKIGLSGKSFVSLLLGTSCSALAILSTRTIKNDNERKKTGLFIPFIPCSAKVPIIIMFISLYYNNSFIIFLSFYILAIVIIIFLSMFFKNKADSYILEIPPLKFPNLKIALVNTYDKTKSFIKRICSIILLFSIINWFLMSFDLNLNYGVQLNKSILYLIGSKISYLTYPFLGCKSIESSLAILSGILAKEQVISTMQILNLQSINTINCYSFICFNLFSIPCINTLVAIKNEYGVKYLFYTIFIELLVAYLFSILIFRVMLWIS